MKATYQGTGTRPDDDAGLFHGPGGREPVPVFLRLSPCKGKALYLKRDRNVEGRFLQFGGQLHVSVITVGELFSGVLSSRASSRLLPGLLAMLKDTVVLDATFDVAYTFGVIRAPLLDRGLPGPGMDLMIAATALVHDLTLVTHNTQDYDHVPGLRLADWLVP